MNAPICVAALQMNSIDKLESNLDQAYGLIHAAHMSGAQLAVLPEYFAWMSERDTDKLSIAETALQGTIQNFLCRTAKEFKLWLIGGTVPIQSTTPNKVFNRCPIISPDGLIVHHYDKIHLFSLSHGTEKFCESNTIVAGSSVSPFDLPFGRIGLGVCYDLRFPEFFRKQLPMDLLALPAAFTYTTGHAHWNTLLAARAIENQCYVIASGQTGIHPGNRRTFGHSQIIDPWGTVLAQKTEDIGIVTAHIDPLYLTNVRQRLPALMHQRFLISDISEEGLHGE